MLMLQSAAIVDDLRSLLDTLRLYGCLDTPAARQQVRELVEEYVGVATPADDDDGIQCHRCEAPIREGETAFCEICQGQPAQADGVVARVYDVAKAKGAAHQVLLRLAYEHDKSGDDWVSLTLEQLAEECNLSLSRVARLMPVLEESGEILVRRNLRGKLREASSYRVRL